MPQIPIAKVLRQLDDGQVYPLYLLHGDEAYLIQDYTTACIDRILPAASRAFNCDIFTADSESLQEALGLARTLPMLAAHRVVVLHQVQQLRQADLKHLDAYAAQPSESTALLCTSSETDLKKFPPHLRTHAAAVACQRLVGGRLRAWVKQRIESQGYTLTEEAVDGFLLEQQNDLWTLAREIEKLCTYVGTPRQVDIVDVQTVCHVLHLQSIFALSDAIGGRRITLALPVLNDLLAQGEPPLLVFSMIVRNLRLLWSIGQLAQQGQSLAAIAKTLRLPQRVCRQLAAQSRQLAPERLRQLYEAAIEADLTFKTSNTPPRAILEGLVLELCVGGEA